MRARKKRRRNVGKDQKKKIFGRRVRSMEKCACLCHDPKKSYVVFHLAPCCGYCPHCKQKRIKVFYLDAHKEKCRRIIFAAKE